MNYKYLLLSILTGLFFMPQTGLYAQDLSGTATNGSRFNSIRTAVPFLLITPDARAGAMSDAGAATQPDINAASINPSKLAFLEQKYGFSVSYSPWLKNLVSDISLSYLSGYYRINENSAIGASLRYFSLGNLQLADIYQQSLGTYNPNEFAFDATYAKRFGESFSLGTTIRYIYSNLTTGQFTAGQDARAGRAVAADVSAYLKKPVELFGYDAIFAAGANISNMGTKISYSDAGTADFLPANLKIGAASTLKPDDFNEITLALDFNKLLVPTQPLYTKDGSILSGKNPDRSIPSGVFGSFSDAPGGFSEELKEVNIAAGIEYWYQKKFALRTGYFYENPQKGNRRYFTMGLGVKYENFNLNLSYLLANTQKSPLANTLRFSLLFNFGDSNN